MTEQQTPPSSDPQQPYGQPYQQTPPPPYSPYRYPGQPYPPGYYPPPPPAPHQGLSIAGLVVGIVGVVLSGFVSTVVYAVVLGVLAIVFGGVSWQRKLGKAAVFLGIGALAFALLEFYTIGSSLSG